jgi:hypothetical protein
MNVKPECRHKCRFLQITDTLWLCPHAAYGETSYMKGAVEEARAILERLGGYDVVLRKLEDSEQKRAEEQREKQRSRQQRLASTLRYE